MGSVRADELHPRGRVRMLGKKEKNYFIFIFIFW
jgi:hypothetical protein